MTVIAARELKPLLTVTYIGHPIREREEPSQEFYSESSASLFSKVMMYSSIEGDIRSSIST